MSEDRREPALPKWGRKIISELRAEIISRDKEIERLRMAHSLLFERSWFTIQGPPVGLASQKPYRLWFLDRDEPFPACSLGPGDVLMVGRKIDRKG